MPEKKRRKKSSAAKALRQSRRARLRNLAVISLIKTAAGKAKTALRAGDAQIAGGLTREACGLIDRAASKGMIHKRAAARRKSRLARGLSGISRPAAREQDKAS